MTTLLTITVIILGCALAAAVAIIIRCYGRISALNADNARVDTARAVAEQRLADAEAAHARQLESERRMLEERFKSLAADALQANSQQLDLRSRASIEAVLAPLRTSLDTFTRDFKDCYSAEHNDRLSLREGIQSLVELNRRVGDETRRLADALKGNTRFQGRWGEMVLLNILEHSGLEEGRWLVLQDSNDNGEGRLLRPDAIINCPHDRKIVIDSKASLSDYLRMLNANTDAERDAALHAHIRSVENHIRELRDKAYQDHIGLNKADFVLMFMPHEGAYIAAMQGDPDLWQRAYDSRVIIVSPTHLVTVVKLVEQMWTTEDTNVNAIRIAEEATKMLDKLMGALDDIARAGEQLDKARTAYNSACSRLSEGRGNVLKRIENLNALGIKSKKSVPPALTDRQEN